jgi:hypothetical protein
MLAEKIKKLKLKRIASDSAILEDELRAAVEETHSEERTNYISYINYKIAECQSEVKRVNKTKFILISFIKSFFESFKFLEK